MLGDEDCPYPEFVPVLGVQHTLSGCMIVIVSYSSDVDKHATLGIDPSGINQVKSVRLLAIGIIRIDFEQILATLGDSWRLVVECGHVVIRREIMHVCFRDLTENGVEFISTDMMLVGTDSHHNHRGGRG